jgi:putative ABC transport system permease protein
MSKLRAILTRSLNVLHNRRQHERDLHAELHSHLQLHIDDKVAQGMSSAEARRQALLQLGGLEQTKEAFRDQRSLPFIESLLQDVRFAGRLLKKSPAFTAVAIFTLALGIGANTATYSASNTYLGNPVSLPEADRVLMVLNLAPGQTEGWSDVSPADFLDWRAQSRSFDSFAAFDWDDLNLTGAGDPLKIQGYRVTANFFDTLRVTPLLGRAFLANDDQPGQDREAILSAGLWRRQFASDPNVVGRTVRLDGIPTQIIGVMKDDVRFPLNAELWIPMVFTAQEKTQRNAHSISPIARLKSGVSLQEAQAEMRTIQARLSAQFPEQETGWTIQMIQVGEFVAGPGRGYMILLLGAVAFVLLIACTNVMNLLFARSTERQSEYALRIALGATRWRLIRQALVESILLAMGALVVGLLLGSWWISLIRAGMPPEVSRYIPSWDTVRLNRGVFLYTFGVACAAGLVAGLLPAFLCSASNPNDALKESGRGKGMSLSRTRVRNAFVVVEIALSLVLLVGAALMSRGVQTLFAINFKFEPQSIFVFRATLPASRYGSPQQRNAFFESLSDHLNRSSGVQLSSISSQVPFSGEGSDPFSIEDRPSQPGEFQAANYIRVSPDFFPLFHIPVIEGRDFTDNDSPDRPPVAIVSESLAKRLWPGGGAIGHRLKAGDDHSTEPWATIVGVVPEVSYDPYRHDPPPAIYLPTRQHDIPDAYVAVRSNLDTKALAPIIRTALSNVDPDQPMYDAMPFAHLISNQVLGLSYVAVLLSVTGLMALVLSAVGTAGVMAFSVAQRSHETGIRMALGAKPQDILYMFLLHGLKLLVLGVAIGLPLSIALAKLLSSLLFGVRSDDLLSFLTGALLLNLAVIVACYIPARRASHCDPIIALRYE